MHQGSAPAGNKGLVNVFDCWAVTSITKQQEKKQAIKEISCHFIIFLPQGLAYHFGFIGVVPKAFGIHFIFIEHYSNNFLMHTYFFTENL